MDHNEEEAKRLHPEHQVESEEESDSDSDSDVEEDSDETYGYEFLDSLGVEEEVDDDIDPDVMSYEELMELGEAIGAERRGLSEKEILGCSRAMTWRKEASGIDRCVVCQVEYQQGEEGLLALNACQHPYHFDCISNWLRLKNICPICSNQPL